MASGSKKINILIGADTRKLNAALKKSTRNMQRFGRRMSLMGTDLLRSVTIPLVLAGGALLKFGAELDASKRALTAVMGSSKLASKHFLELKEAAKAPGLDFRAAIQGTLRFQSMGISAETATKTLTAFGKAVALSGGGADEFARTIQQLSDMFSRQKVTMEDWRRVITAAPTVVKALRDEFDGMTDAVKIASEVGFDEFMTRLTANLNAAAGPTNSLGNSFNNLASSSRHVAGELGLLLSKYSGLQEFIGKAVTKLDKFAIALTTNKALAKEWGENITIAVKALGIIAGTGLITKIIGSLTLLAVQFTNVARGALLMAAALTGLGGKGIGKGLVTKAVAPKLIGGNIAAGASFAGGALAAKVLAGFQAFGLGLAIGAILAGIMRGAAEIAARNFGKELNHKMSLIFRALSVVQGSPTGFLYQPFEREYQKIVAGAKATSDELLALLFENAGVKQGTPDPTPKGVIDETFAKIMEKYRDSVKQLNAEFKLTKDRSKKLEEEISNLQSTIVDLEVAGFGAGKAFEELNEQFEKLVGFAEALESLGKGDDEFFEKINANMPTIRAMPTTLSADTALPGDKAEERAALLSSEIASGINPSEEDKEEQLAHLARVAEQTQALEDAARGMGEAFAQSFIGIIDGTRSLSEALADFFKKMMKKLIAAIIQWAILSALSGGAVNIGTIIKQAFGFGALIAGKGEGLAVGGTASKRTSVQIGEYTNAYNKPEMVGRVDQWAGLIRDFMGGHNMMGQQSSPELALRGEDIWRMYNRTAIRMNKMGITS